jgi:hypothetical protein
MYRKEKKRKENNVCTCGLLHFGIIRPLGFMQVKSFSDNLQNDSANMIVDTELTAK